MPESHAELISRRAEAMALKLTGLMEAARRTSDLDELHALVQDLVVIRQAALAIKEDAAEEAAKLRTWQVPSIPDEVATVTDLEGETWRRYGRIERRLWRCDDGAEVELEKDVISEYGPVKEARDHGPS